MEPTPKLCMRLAEPADLDELVRARLMVLRAANGLAPQAPLPQVEAETRRYFEEGLVTGSFAAVLVSWAEEVTLITPSTCSIAAWACKAAAFSTCISAPRRSISVVEDDIIPLPILLPPEAISSSISV